MKKRNKIFQPFRRLLDRATAALRRYPLSHRFFAICLCMCIAPLLVASVTVFHTSYQAETDRYVSFARQMMAQMGDHLHSRLLSMRSDAIDLAYNTYVQDYVEAYSAESSSAGRVPVTDEVVHAVIGKFDTTSAGTGLVLLSTTGEPCYVYNFQNRLYMYFYEESKNNLMQSIEESEGGFWYYATPKDYYMKNLEGRFYLPDTEEPVLYYGLEMKRLTGTNSVGYLVITLRPKVLTDLFAHLDEDGVSTVYLIDQDGSTIIHNGQSEQSLSRDVVQNILEGPDGIQVLPPSDPLFGDYVIYRTLDETGWCVVEVIDGQALGNMALSNSFDIAVLILMVMALLPIVFLVINRTLRSPLDRILSAIGNIRRGDFSARIRDDGNDEFTQIALSIDSMSANLQRLVAQIRKREQQQKETEIELLQMQINPHFITNTLNTVAWMASLQHQKNISSILTSLSALLNQTLRSGRDFIPLSEELEYIRWYIEIQQYRGTVQYNLNVAVEEELLSCLIPPFTLEALVENSVTHGVVGTRDSLEITVKATRAGDTLECVVIDNGAGMDRGTLEKLGKGPSISGRGLYRIHGIGVSNVQKRLQIYFGKEYGLNFDSVPGQFTMATVRMPLQRESGETGLREEREEERVPGHDSG